jgi:pSer/pThr/pTyr-binding forkhead associated (FHA) protein
MRVNYQLTGGSFERLEISKTSILIGRSSDCEIRVVDESISRKHCLIEVKEGQVFVTDLNSANGIYIDGKRIAVGEPVLYPTYLSLSIGPQLTFNIESIDDSSKASFAIKDAAESRVINLEKKKRSLNETPQTPKPAKRDGGSLLIIIAALVILVGGVWMFFEFREQIAPSTPTAKLRTRTNAPVKDHGNF